MKQIKQINKQINILSNLWVSVVYITQEIEGKKLFTIISTLCYWCRIKQF